MFLADEIASLERFQRSGLPTAETLGRVLAMQKSLGITRIADITGLDRLGLPVAQAVRPFSLSIPVSLGKGPTAAHAVISAVLEAAENFFAERVAGFETLTARASSLNISPGYFDCHVDRDDASTWREQETTWVVADELLRGGNGLVPFDLVHTAFVIPPLHDEPRFLSSTQGLAASFSESDAITHAILERVERDAIARARATHGFLHDFRIDQKTIDHPAILGLLETLQEKGLAVGLWHVPSVVAGVTVVWCQLMERGSPQNAILPYAAQGSAAALDPALAISHALYEAAQARLAVISGARDDITRAFYPKHPNCDDIAAQLRLLAEGPRRISFLTLCCNGGGTGTLGQLLEALEKGGLETVYVVRIDTNSFDLSVVRALLPTMRPLTVE